MKNKFLLLTISILFIFSIFEISFSKELSPTKTMGDISIFNPGQGDYYLQDLFTRDTTLFFDDFEGTDLWTSEDLTATADYWHIDTYKAYSGKSWWCGSSTEFPTPGYGNYWMQYLTTPTIDLSTVTDTSTALTFYHNYSVEPPSTGLPPGFNAWDGINVRISTDGGNTFQIIRPDGGYPYSSCYAFGDIEGQGVPGWAGSSGGWKSARFSLKQYIGQQVKIRFVFGSDPACSAEDNCATNLYGWLIDNISVASLSQTYFTEDAESSSSPMVISSWFAGDYWQKSTSNFHSANNSWWCPVQPLLENTLTSPDIDLTNLPSNVGGPVILSLWYDVDLPDNWNDNCGVYISYKDGSIWSNWIYLTRLDGVSATPNWKSKDNTSVERRRFDLTPFIGKVIKFQFAFYTDGANNIGRGVYIDDVKITAKITDIYSPPVNLSAYSDYNNTVPLKWDSPQSNGATRILLYDNMRYNTYIQDAQAVAVKFTTTSSQQLLKVSGLFYTMGDFNLRILSADGPNGSPGKEMLFVPSQKARSYLEDWVDVDLSSYNIAVDGDFYVAMYFPTKSPGIIATKDTIFANPSRSWVLKSGIWYQQSSLYSSKFAFMMRAVVSPIVSPDSYKIYKSDMIDGTYTLLSGEITSTYYDDVSVVNGKTYYYKVSAMYGMVESEKSNVSSATPNILLYYDDGTAERTLSSVGNNAGYAVKFTPIQYPIGFTSARYYISSNPVPFLVGIWDDDGANGMPGTPLVTPFTTTPTTTGWHTVDLSSLPASISSGSFYIGAIQQGNSFPVFGADENNSFVNANYNYVGTTGNWSRMSNFGLNYNLMFRVLVNEKAKKKDMFLSESFVNGKVFVKFKKDVKQTLSLLETFNSVDGIATTGIPSVDALNQRFNVYRISKVFPGSTAPSIESTAPDLSRIYAIYFPLDQDVMEVVRAYNSNENFEYVEPNYIRKLCAIPNDPSYALQWHLPAISAPQAWDISKGDSSVVVAILDSGVDINHPDLKDKIWFNPAEDLNGNGKLDNTPVGEGGDIDGLDNDGNGFVDDVVGWDFITVADNAPADNDPSPEIGGSYNDTGVMHGTHVAGIVGATTNNGVGIASIGWNVKLMAVRVGTDEGGITNGIEGIYYAANMGADVINMSFGGTTFSFVEYEALQYAHSKGCVLVAAAGNDNSDGAHYPSAYPNVISVASTGFGDKKASYSNYDETVDISAPGGDAEYYILSTFPYIPAYNYTTYYGGSGWMGTSMASPVAAGVAALIKSQNPDSSNDWIAERLINTADNIYGITPNCYYVGQLGTGRVNAYNALNSTLNPLLTYNNYTIISDGDNDGILDPGETITLTITLSNRYPWKKATNVSATLTTTDTDIVISDSTASYSDIVSGGTAMNLSDVFSFSINSGATAHKANFLLKIHSDGYDTSATFSMYIGTPVVLLVDDDMELVNTNTGIESALNAINIPYTVWNTKNQGTPDVSFLNKFEVVIWSTGFDEYTTLTSDEHYTIKNYLIGGGKLLLTGRNIGNDLTVMGSSEDSSFYHNYLVADFVGVNTSSQLKLAGVTGDPITNGMTTTFYSLTYNKSDVIKARKGVIIFNYGASNYTDKGAGLRYDNGTYKLVYLAFDMGTFSRTASRDTLMARCVKWLRTPAVSVEKDSEVSVNLPSKFNLSQNYPNPFNPETVISYQLAVGGWQGPGNQVSSNQVRGNQVSGNQVRGNQVRGNQVRGNQVRGNQVSGKTTDYRLPITDYQSPITNYHVNLSIYSITGQLVRTLVNEEQSPGYYSVKWDGKDDNGKEVSSGLYIYTIKAGEFSATKRMIMIK